MYTFGLIMLFGGMGIALIGSIVAGGNMIKASQGKTRNMFVSHFGAMIVMAIGGFSSVAGLIILVATYLKQLVS